MISIMKKIELVCNEYNSILNENIHQHIKEKENSVEEFVQNLELKMDVVKIIKEKDEIVNYFKDDNIYQCLNMLKQNAQISLNLFQYPFLYNECQTYYKPNKHGVILLNLEDTSKNEIKDFRKHIGRYAALYLIIKQIETLKSCDTSAKSSPKKVIDSNINNFSTYSKGNIENDSHNNSSHIIFENSRSKENNDKELQTSSILMSTLSEDSKNKLALSRDLWICKLCQSQNDYDNFNCNNCGNYGSHYQMWRCETCTFINNKINVQCKICVQKNPHLRYCACRRNLINDQFNQVCVVCDERLCKKCQSKGDTKLLSGLCSSCKLNNWVCPNKLCNYVNCLELPFCEKCLTLRDQKQDGVLKMKINNKEIIQWQCSFKSCLKINDITIQTCIRCDNKRLNRDLRTCFACGWNKLKTKCCAKCDPV